MDSKERTQREKDGFGERGEKLYDAEERDERKDVREERKKKQVEKETSDYDPSDDSAHEGNPNKTN